MASTDILRLPMVPLREAVVFPHTLVPFVVGRQSSLRALECVEDGDRRIFLACQRDASSDEPAPEEIHSVGAVATVVQSLKVASGNVRLLVEGVVRARALDISRNAEGYYCAEVCALPDRGVAAAGLDELAKEAAAAFEEYVKANPALPAETLISTLKVEDPGRLADTIAAHLLAPAEIKQDLLERTLVGERLERLLEVLHAETDKLRVDAEINGRVKGQLERAQREYYLAEKIKAIQKELGRTAPGGDVEELAGRIEAAGLSAEALEKARGELKRLEAMPSQSAEATVARAYLEWLAAVPWKGKSRENRDLKRARRVLDEDHFGLAEAKERILEFLAVRKLAPEKKQPAILCFVGPPGVGKTSLARSIARATGRKFVRVSLGGVRDEAEIRGHRRTYIGSMPGRIIQSIRQAGSRNPVMMLDEVDKLANDFRGDPQAALLEVLDPEQNNSFRDHYLGVPFDLSQVLFIATANLMDTIHPAFRDRMEVLRLSGYTEEEKLAIARRHIIPKQMEENALAGAAMAFSDGALRELVHRYTREAGLRNLERRVAAICRKAARRVAEGKPAPRRIGANDLEKYLGPPPPHSEERLEGGLVGVVTGLAWTAAGGDVLFIEAMKMSGDGKLNLTGQLGGVMKESAQAALSWARGRAAELGLAEADFTGHDFHVHVPEGAIPKDGPSAGITLAAALVSVLTERPVRREVAMTGEITLRGRILPIGGVKEKVLAARRAGAKLVILPKANERESRELSKQDLGGLELRFAEEMEQVLEIALLPRKSD